MNGLARYALRMSNITLSGLRTPDINRFRLTSKVNDGRHWIRIFILNMDSLARGARTV